MKKSLINPRLSKKEREKAVLLGLVELYIQTNKPVGSSSLQISGFDFISSATIRNYFSKWEKEGFLQKQHASGGSIPTSLAYREYINHYQYKHTLSSKESNLIKDALYDESKQITTYLSKSCDFLSELTHLPTFILQPQLDQDYIQKVHLIDLEKERILFIVVTDFGQIYTQSLHTPRHLNSDDLGLIQKFFQWKLGKSEKPMLNSSLLKLAQYFYNEIVVRHILGATNNSQDMIYKTGLSKLMSYPEFIDATALANGLSLFDNNEHIQTILFETIKLNRLTCWVGKELCGFSPNIDECMVMAVPYHINQRPVGAIALLGPARINYKKLLSLVNFFAQELSNNLTKNVYKYKITFHQKQNPFLSQEELILLEDKSNFKG